MAHKCDGCRYKGEYQEMMFRPFGVCTKETNLIEAEKAYNADKCPHKKTNADRIRAMSDECFSCFLALVENRKTGKTNFDDTSDFWLEWLKQSAE